MSQVLSIWLLVYPLSSPYKEDVLCLGRNLTKISDTLGLHTSLVSDYSLCILCKGIMDQLAMVISENMNSNNKTVIHNIHASSTTKKYYNH
jgi:hypothetical protein